MIMSGSGAGGAVGIAACRRMELPKVHDDRGNLTFVEGGRHIPFEIRRVYYLYDVPGGSVRAGHAHKRLQQVLVAIAGSFDVSVHDGDRRATYRLNRANEGLYIPAMVWREISDFSSGSLCLAFASDLFDEADYYRDYAEYLRAAVNLR